MRSRVSWASSFVLRTIPSQGSGLDIHTCLYVNSAPSQEACKAPTRFKPMYISSRPAARLAVLFTLSVLLAACGGPDGQHPGGHGGGGGGMPPLPVAIEEVKAHD